MRKFTWKQKFRYRFDNLMARGTLALIGGLSVISLLLIIAVSLVVHIAGLAPAAEGGEAPGFIQLAWMGLMRTLDAGTMGGDQGSWAYLMAMLFITLGGIFVVSTLIGVLSSGIENKLDELRKGRSLVLEQEHTVLLGWSPQVFSIVNELREANSNKPRSCVAVLAEVDKVEMEDEIRSKVGPTGRMHVVCRNGSPTDLTDLEIVNPHDARSIVILSSAEEDSDFHVIKTILALTNNPNRRQEPYHIVAAIRDPKKAEVARMVGGDEVQVVVVGDLIARVTAQTCRQSGLSAVLTELLDFGGDEIYFCGEPALAGKTFGDALMAYEDSSVIGLRRSDGKLLMNPPMDTKIKADDKVIAISEDDDTVVLSGLSDFKMDDKGIRPVLVSRAAPERTLLLGWNNRAPLLLRELDTLVSSGSTLTVVSDHSEEASGVQEVAASFKNQRLEFKAGDLQDRPTLDGLDIPGYNHVIVLSDSDRLEMEDADSRTLVTLLHLRDIRTRSGRSFSIVSEMLDVRNRELAEVTQADDFIVSDKLVSLMLSQISENRELTGVFAELFGASGARLSFKPIEDYVETGRPMNFYTVVESAKRRSEVAIGYSAHTANVGDIEHGVVVNPSKSALVTFKPGDRVAVLAGS